MSYDFNPEWMSEELVLLRESAIRFAETTLGPIDAEARLKGNVGRDTWRKAGEVGLLCSDIPEEYGGAGGDMRHEAIITKEFSRRSLQGMNHQVHSIVAHYFLNHGTSEQKNNYLPKMATGKVVGSIAMTEPGTGSDLQSIRTHARREGDYYVINGSKTFVSNGFLAGFVLVVVKTDPKQSAKGMSIIIVDTDNQPGFSVGRVLDKIGQKSGDTCELFFDDVKIHKSQLLGGEEGKGFYQLMSDLPYERLHIAISAQGAMEGAYNEALAYVRERKVFGKVLADFQNTKFKLAEVATQISVSQAFVDNCISEMLKGELSTEKASMAKLYCTEAQGKVVDECLQLFGGYGYMSEYLIGRMYVDARVQRIYGGTSEIMKEVISRSL